MELYKKDQIDSLKNIDAAIDSLNFTLKHFGKEDFLFSLYNVAIAQGFSSVASRCGYSRESLYKILQPTGNPRLETLMAILDSIGLQIQIKRKKDVLGKSNDGLAFEVSKMPRMNSLLATNPDMAKMWHPDKNGHLGPNDIIPTSRRKIWWKCSKNHEWEATPSSVIKNFKVDILNVRNYTKESFVELVNNMCPLCKISLQGYNER